MQIKLDHIMIRTHDLKKSEEFYTEILSLKVVARDNRMNQESNKYDSIFVSDGSFKLEIVYNDGLDNINSYQIGDSIGHIGVYVDSLDEIVEKYNSKYETSARVVLHENNEKKYKIATIKTIESMNIALVQKLN